MEKLHLPHAKLLYYVMEMRKRNEIDDILKSQIKGFATGAPTPAPTRRLTN